MAVDTFTIPSRADVETQYKTFLSARVPGADVSTNSPADLDARMEGGVTSPTYARALAIYNGRSIDGMTGAQVVAELKARGDGLLPAAGASGWILIQASSGGGTIQNGDGGSINGQGYVCIVAIPTLFHNGDPCPVRAINVGPATDQPAGATFAWTTAIPGIGPQALVQARADGVSGLIGGADVESLDDAKARLKYQNANPAQSGNAAEYNDRCEKTPSLSAEAGFCFPGILGTGTTGFTCTMRRSTPQTSRIPSSAELALFTAWTPGAFPADDTALACALVSNPVTVVLQVKWSGTNWSDPVPWPTYASSMVAVSNAVTITATTFRLANIATVKPAAGMTIAFYDAPNALFRQKKILTATMVTSSTYDIVCDTTNGSSDVSFTPLNGQPACPWSDGLNTIALALQTAMAGLGPGEQVGSFWDPGQRQRRDPDPTQWPYTITHRFFDAALDPITSVADHTMVCVYDGITGLGSIPYVTPTGNPGVSSYLTETQYFAVFAE